MRVQRLVGLVSSPVLERSHPAQMKLYVPSSQNPEVATLLLVENHKTVLLVHGLHSVNAHTNVVEALN